MSGDYWTFLAGEPEEYPRRLLVTLNNSTPGNPDPFSEAHTFVHAIPDRFTELTPFEIPFSQFWRRGNIIDDRDRERATWGSWYAAGQQGADSIVISDRGVTEIIFGDTYYTQCQVAWDFGPGVTSFGAWVGIDTNRCPSQGRGNINFLINPVVSGVGSLTIRVKVKDAQGSYFYQDQTVTTNTWQRVTVNLGGMQVESGSSPMVHPLQIVDIGIASSPPPTAPCISPTSSSTPARALPGPRNSGSWSSRSSSRGWRPTSGGWTTWGLISWPTTLTPWCRGWPFPWGPTARAPGGAPPWCTTPTRWPPTWWVRRT